MNNQQMKQFVENNPDLVMMKPTSKEGLFVLKYKKKVFYDNLWTPELELCRGTIVDRDFNVASIPFTKIYNYGIEDKAPTLSPDTVVTVYRKVNGFMAAITWHDGEILVSTTGSIDSNYVQYVKDMMSLHSPLEQWKDMLSSFCKQTFLFECVHPNDPHIIPEQAGLYYLGTRWKDWDDPVIHPNVGWIGYGFCKDLQVNFELGYNIPLSLLLNCVKDVQHEGFVCYTDDGQAFKIKSPYYLIKKFLARCNNTSKLLHKNVKEKFDEEYYPLIDHVRANIKLFTEMDEQERLEYIRSFLENN